MYSMKVAALAAVMASVPVFAQQAAPLALEQAQSMALARALAPAAYSARARSAQEMAQAGKRLPDPVLKLGVENLPVSGMDRFRIAAEPMTMRSVGVMQEFTRGAKRDARAQRYGREADMAQAEAALATVAVERDTALAWLDAWYAEAMLALAAEQRRQAGMEAQAVDAAWRGGRAAQADVFGARAMAAEIDDRISELRQRSATARTMLERWTGPQAGPLGAKPDIATMRGGHDAYAAKLPSHPQVDVLDRQVDVAAARVREAHAERSTDFAVELMYQKRGSAFGDMASVSVSVPLQWNRRNRQDREHSASLAMLEEARSLRDEAEREHDAEIRVLHDNWRANLERLARYETTIVPLAESRSAAALAAWRGGKSSLADLLAARRGELDTRLQALQLESDTAARWARLNFLTPSKGHP